MLAGISVDLAHLDIFHTEVAVRKNVITHQRTNEDSIDQITFTIGGGLGDYNICIVFSSMRYP